MMIKGCKLFSMKPICDHPAWCATDPNALYLGQDGHISHGGHRDTMTMNAVGWNRIKVRFVGLCVYAPFSGHRNAALKDNALCNIPTNSHSWKTPAQANPGFMCGKTGDTTKSQRSCYIS